jgi:hypothetical protein
MRCDHEVPAPEEMSRDELIVLVGERDARIAAQDGQITAMATQISELLEANEALAASWNTCCSVPSGPLRLRGRSDRRDRFGGC